MERKIQFIALFICIVLPFTLIRSPLEIVSYVIPFWLNYYGGVGLWNANGKPLWETFLACYGVASTSIIFIYLGTAGIQTLFIKLGSRLPLFWGTSQYQRFNSFAESKKKGFTEWLRRQGVWLILFVLLMPLPFTDLLAAATMELTKTRYGLWYLLAVNLFRTYLIVFFIYTYSGVRLVFF